MPPPASGLPARLVLGPVLRAQSDRRLVRLVRDGYESAFEEIVRRYRRPLDRFAASIVGGRSEDVTQDSFRKALVALRRDDDEIDLRPWLYRIVRNTALNDLRDRPPAAAELAEELTAGGRSAAAVAEERAEVAALTASVRALPEKQRAALVMRELEGMSHEEIAAALGVSGGAARQAIARGRATVRGGLGALVPLPLLRALASGGDGAAEAAAGPAGVGGVGAAAGGAAGAGALGGVGASVGASGLGGALKVGLATVAVAGGIGTGVALEHGGGHRQPNDPRAGVSAPAPGETGDDGPRSTPSAVIAKIDPGNTADSDGPSDHHSPRGHDDRGDEGRGHRDIARDRTDDDIAAAVTAEPVAVDDQVSSDRGHGGPGRSGGDGHSGHGHGGSTDGGSGHSGSRDDAHSGASIDGGSHDGGSGGDGSGATRPGSDDRSGGSNSTSSTSSEGGRGSDDTAEPVVEPTPPEASPSSSSSGGPGPSSSSTPSASGSSDGPSPTLDSAPTDDHSGSDGSSGSSGGPEVSP
jgi:RNA polymerase sigma factor (sigma-70 family)